MQQERLERALAMIDQANQEDPHQELCEGRLLPRALVYGQRMSAWLKRLAPEASEAQQIAARAQHIRRFRVPREHYPPTREGYLQWRTFLYRFHAEQAAEIARAVGYDEATVAAIANMVGKRGIKRDPDVQLIEDVACLVFLEHYLADFAKTKDYDAAKLIDIVRKTWRKMSARAQAAALTIALPPPLDALVGKAVAHGAPSVEENP